MVRREGPGCAVCDSAVCDSELHLKELSRKQHTPKTEAEHMARVLLVQCWKDSATYFGQIKLLVSQREVLKMCSGLPEDLRSKKNLPYLVPWKPSEPLARTNLASHEEVPDRGLEGVKKPREVPGGH